MSLKCPRCGSDKVFTPDGHNFKAEYGNFEVYQDLDNGLSSWMDSYRKTTVRASVSRLDLCGECGLLMPVVEDAAKLYALYAKGRRADANKA
jgi:hypothetical protein